MKMSCFQQLETSGVRSHEYSLLCQHRLGFSSVTRVSSFIQFLCHSERAIIVNIPGTESGLL